MKKIALNYIYLSKTHAGGKDQVGLNLLKGFQENGVAKNMQVICYDYSVEIIRNISNDISIVAIPAPNQTTEMKRMIGNLVTNTFLVPKLIKNYKIDVIFQLDCNNGLRRYKCRSIVIPHDIKAVAHRDLPGLHIPIYKYMLYRAMYALDFYHADTIIGISDVDKDEIQTFYPKYQNKVIRIYNPIDIPLCSNVTRKREPNITAINLQFHHKNTITLIKAFELIKDQIEENLILVGNVPKRVSYLKDYVQEHNLESRVKFTGFVSDERRNQLLQNCRLYVSPTLFEGFGMVSVESIISGVPTLLSDIPSNYEVTQGLCDYYRPANDYIVLAEKIKEILSRKMNTDDLVKNARMLWEVYNYRRIADIYWSIFNE